MVNAVALAIFFLYHAETMKVEARDYLTFDVQSDTRKDIWHLVDLVEEECSCEYSQFSKGKVKCKHRQAAEEYLMKAMLDKVRQEEKQKRRKPNSKFVGISSMSSDMQKKMREYTKRRKLFLDANPMCVWENTEADDIHHSRGRIGDLLLDMRYWLPVSRATHDKIHKNPTWAKENGLLQDWMRPDEDALVECKNCGVEEFESRMIKNTCMACVKLYVKK